MKIQATLLSLLSLSIFLPACGASSPEAYIEKSTKIACQYLEKCEEAMWDMAGFDSVNDCRDQLLELSVDGTSLRDAFVESCTDFDKSAARKCLAAARKAKRSCDDMSDEPACEEVCGPAPVAGQALAEPMPADVVARALEQLESSGELELVDDELTSVEP